MNREKAERIQRTCQASAVCVETNEMEAPRSISFPEEEEDDDDWDDDDDDDDD